MENNDNDIFCKEINIESNIGKAIKLSTPIINASGCICMTKDELDTLNSTEKLGAIITKTCTIEPRKGNPEPRYWTDYVHTINSMGLPNKGIDYYIDYVVSTRSFDSIYYLRKELRLKELRLKDLQLKDSNNLNCLNDRNIVDNNKPLIISIGGLSLEENMNIIRKFIEFNNSGICITTINKNNSNDVNINNNIGLNITGCSGLEFNLSCPNIVGKGQLGYDFEQFDNYLSTIFETELSSINKQNLALGLKLPPYFELTHFGEVKDILIKYPRLDYITTINSIANGLVIDIETELPVIAPKNGLGGIGGNSILPTALSNVYNFNKVLNGKIDIIGCGGVISGSDIFRHILCGATCVAVGSTLKDYGTQVIDKLYKELIELMKSKNYYKLDDFKGKLK